MIEAQEQARRSSADACAEDPLADLTEEMATYRDRLPELLRGQEGQFVLVKGTEVASVFTDRSSALREGYLRFGIVPFLVRQIATTEPVMYLPNVSHT